MNAVQTPWRHGRVRCADAVHARLFDEELIILDLAQGQYFALDPVGARLWSGLQAGRTIEQIAQELVAEYETTLDQAVIDLVALGDELVVQGLMIHDDNAGAVDDG